MEAEMVYLDDVIRLLDGIDRDDHHTINGVEGWWETGEGAEFGKSVLRKIKEEAFIHKTN